MASENPASIKNMLEDETFMSVADLKEYVTKREIARASKAVSAVSRADEARQEYLRKLSVRIEVTPELSALCFKESKGPPNEARASC